MIILLFFILVIVLIYIEYKRTSILFSYYNLFILYWFLYTVGIYLSDSYMGKSYDFSTLLILLGGIFFILGYYFIPFGSKKIKQKKKFQINRVPDLSMILIFLSGVALLFAFYIIFMKIGIHEYFFTSRAHRSLITRPYSHFMIFIDLFNIISGLSLFLYYLTGRKTYKRIFLTIFFIAMIHAVMTISRNNLVLLVIPVIYVSHYFDKLKAKTISVIMIVGLLIGVLWKSLLYILLIGSFHGGTTVELKAPREFVVWREIGENILDKNIALHGKSYLDAFINFVYPFNHTDSLSLWYVKNYEPHTYEIGGGRGFSNILEAYINFDIAGVVIVFFVLGVIIYLFQLKSQNTPYLFLPYMFSLAFVHRIFRSDFMSLTKTWWWMYFISFTLIFILVRILRKKHA